MALDQLRCKGISKSFNGVRALDRVCLDLPRSGITGLIGPNGAGKTTLLNILTGFERPDSGRYWLGCRELTGMAPHEIARLGVVRTFQEVRLVLEVSALQNVLVAFPRQRGETLAGALLRFGVTREETKNVEKALALLRFVGLEEKACAAGGELSYGEQKLLTLACCLATEAHLLLLDEPVAGVDPEMAHRVLDRLQELRDLGKRVLFVEHNIDAVRRIANQVIVMHDGRIIAEGAPEDVLGRPEIVEAYLG